MILVRLATNKDRNGIDNITKEFDDHAYSHPPKYFDNALTTKNIIVAVEKEKVIGYLIFHIIWGNTPFIELIMVASSHQKKGVGSKLIVYFEREMKQAGFEEILASSELVNKIGNAFFKKQAFKVIGEVSMIYGKEVFFLKKLK